MRSILFILISSIVIPGGNLFAQNNFGFLGGLNFAGMSVKIDNQDIENQSYPYRTAYGLGAIFSIGMPGPSSIQLEPMFLIQGSKVKIDGEEIGKITLSYFNLPVMIHYTLTEDQPHPFVVFGPNLAVLLNSEIDLYNEPGIVRLDTYRNIDLGVNFGAGFQFPLLENTIVIEAQYGVGIINIDKDPASPDKFTRKTSSIKLLLGIVFPVSRF